MTTTRNTPTPKPAGAGKSRAVELFTHLDYQYKPLTGNGELIGVTVNYGANRRLTKKYNSTSKGERSRLRGEPRRYRGGIVG